MGVLAIGRKSIAAGEAYQLREPPVPYGKGWLKNNPAEAGQNWRPDLGQIYPIRNCPAKSGTISKIP